jgi:hypothetical protein
MGSLNLYGDVREPIEVAKSGAVERDITRLFGNHGHYRAQVTGTEPPQMQIRP